MSLSSLQSRTALNRSNILLRIAVGYLCASAFLFFLGSTPGRGQGLADAVAKARAQGKTSLIMATLTDLPGSMEDLKQASQLFTIVEAIPTEKYVEVTSSNINTWYVLRLVNVIKESPACKWCEQSPSVPTSLLATSNNSLLLKTEGGEASIDGFQVIEGSNAAVNLHIDARYLMFLASPKSASRVRFITAGPSAVYQIEYDGKLIPASTKGFPLSNAVMEVGTLQALRALMKAQ